MSVISAMIRSVDPGSRKMQSKYTYLVSMKMFVLILHYSPEVRGFPGGASGEEPVCQCRRHKRSGFNPWVRKILWRKAWQPTPVFLPGEFHGQRSTSQSVSSVAQSCPTLCDLMNRSTPGLPVHHQLPEFTQIHIHRVGDAIQPSHPLSSPSPPFLFPSNRVFSNESVLHIRWPKYWSLSFSIRPSNEYSGLISFRLDWLDLLAVQESSPTPQFKSIYSLALSFLYSPTLISINDYWKNHSFD